MGPGRSLSQSRPIGRSVISTGTGRLKRQLPPFGNGVVLAVALFWATSVLYLVTANYGPWLVNDARAAAVASWRVSNAWTVTLPPEWEPSAAYWGVEGRDGQIFVNRFPGVAYWSTPMYVITKPAVAGGRVRPLAIPTWPAALMAGLTAAGVVTVLFAILRTELPGLEATWGAFLAGTGTGLWSIAADGMWAHGPAIICLLSCLLAWLRGRPVWTAIFAAAAVTVRPPVVVALVTLWLSALLVGRRRDGAASALGIGSLAGLLVVSAYTLYTFDQFLPVAGYQADTHLDGLWRHSPWQTTRDLVLALVSLDRGLLVYSPFIIVSFVSLYREWRALPAWTIWAAVAGMALLIAQVRATGFRGGEGFFGYRVQMEALFMAMPAMLVSLFRFARDSRAKSGVVLGSSILSVTIHLFGAITPSSQRGL